MDTLRPPHPTTEITRLVEFFAAFGVPTDHMIASPGIELDSEVLRLAPEFVFRVEDLTDEQLAAIESALKVRLAR